MAAVEFHSWLRNRIPNSLSAQLKDFLSPRSASRTRTGSLSGDAPAAPSVAWLPVPVRTRASGLPLPPSGQAPAPRTLWRSGAVPQWARRTSSVQPEKQESLGDKDTCKTGRKCLCLPLNGAVEKVSNVEEVFCLRRRKKGV